MPQRQRGRFMTRPEEQAVLDATVEGLHYLLQVTEQERTEREAEFRRTQDAVAWRIAAYRRDRIGDLQHVCVWRNRPYYARMDVLGDGEEEVESYYLSEVLDDSTDLTGAGGARMIHWTVPMARAFAEQPERIRVGAFRGQVLLKRRFEIKDLVITDMGDALSGYQGHEAFGGDPFLGRVLTMAGEKAGNIVRTVGRMQSEAIFTRAPLLVVHGVPGSGKTQIGQMRVAYLVTDAAVDPSRRLAADNCLILSPSRALVEYMEQVLPSFGVRGVQQESVGSWLAEYAGVQLPYGHTEAERGLVAFAQQLEHWILERISKGAAKIAVTDLPSGNAWRVTSDDVAAGLEEIPDEAYEMVRRTIAQRIARRVKERLLQQMRVGWDQDAEKEYKAREAEIDRAVQRLVGRGLPDLATPEAYRAFLRDRGLRDQIAEEDLGALALLHLRLTGERRRGLHHVVVDEGQNVSPTAYLAMRSILSGANFTVLGDLAQRDPEMTGLNAWEDLKSLGFPDPEVRYLGVNYRSAPAIVAALNVVGPKLNLPFVPIEAVDRPAPPVIALHLQGEATMGEAAAHLLDSLAHTTAAILCRDDQTARTLSAQVDAALPEGAERPFVGSRAEAAGLEFDLVILTDVDGRTFPAEPRAASDLFVLMSRAQNRLILLHRGSLSPLLAVAVVEHERYTPPEGEGVGKK
ncbi:MAG: AAA family ATPase [Thermaerobacter sp.]|nr:AAA family ATPase [Thermaerobacter sp.]